MRNKIEEGQLFAYYGGLLSEHQQEVLRLYYDCDMSLAEISELQNTSRQAVRDVIVRCGDKLLDFEQKLGLVEKIKKVASDFEANIETGNYNKEQIIRLNLILKEIKEI